MYIKTQGPDDDPIVKEVSDQFTARRGYLPSIMRCLTLKPSLLQAMARLSDVSTFGETTLGRRLEEMISSYTSNLLHCRY